MSLIKLLHQTTTFLPNFEWWFWCLLSNFYIKPQHQNRKDDACFWCLLSNFYIKPQQVRANHPEASWCLLSNFYIKPQLLVERGLDAQGVSYQTSTSNHNLSFVGIDFLKVSLIKLLHQTTTRTFPGLLACRCLLSNFYIKPQLTDEEERYFWGVSYQTSTSNHNSSMEIGDALFRCLLSNFYIKPQRTL